MSTFSSVVRKPGQKIVPKVAPRRNVQRHAPKPAAPATALTPSSLSQSPSLGSPSEANPDNDAQDGNAVPRDSSSVQALALNSLDKGAILTLTPPSTVLERLSPLPTAPSSTSDELRQPSGEALIPSVTRSVSREQSSSVPTVASSEPTAHAGAKRKAYGILDGPSSSVTTAQDNDTAVPPTALSAKAGRKKRKLLPSATPDLIVFQPTPTTPRPSVETALQFRRSSFRNDSQPPEALLQQATSQAAAVSELANSIENRTRNLRPRSARDSASAGDTAYAETGDESRAPRRRARKSQGAVIERSATAVVDEAKGRTSKRHRRGQTPEDAEEHQIDTAITKMGDLIQDSGLGKRSETGNRIDEEWSEVKQRWDQIIVTNREAAKEKSKQRRIVGVSDEVADQLAQLPSAVPMPQTAIVNGMIVLDPTSREVQFGAGLDQAVIEHRDGALEDERIYRYVNSGRIGKNAGLKRATRWDDEATALFYKGLRMFGTDFEMISNMFPDLTRKQIKAKYVREEKLNIARVRENLEQQQRIELDEFAEMTNMEFQDPKTIEDEIEAEEKRLREEDEQRRAQEGFVNEDADNILPSTEFDDTVDTVDRDAVARDGTTRVQAAARRVVEDATAPAPKKRQRKPKDLSKARTTKKGRKPLEGVEERIGPIDEVEL